MGLVERTIYRVDPEDEINAIIGQVTQAPETEVVLVLPVKPRPFRNEVNMRLLAGYAQTAGKDLILVTEDRLVARLAAENDVRVVPSLATLYEEEGTIFPSEGEEESDREAYQKRQEELRQERVALRVSTAVRRPSLLARTAVVVLAVAVSGGLWYLFSPKLTVYVQPALADFAATLTIKAAEDVGDGSGTVANEGFETIAAHQVCCPLEAQVTVSATGVKVEGVSRARGTVVFVNEAKSEVVVPAGTVVLTEGGEKFSTKEKVTVPPVQVQYLMDVSIGLKAGTAEVEVEAVVPGERANVSKGRITRISGGFKSLKVRNPEATRGGIDRTVTVVSEKDIGKAREMLEEQLSRQATATLSREASGYLIRESVTITGFSLDQAPSVGDELLQFTASASAQAEGLAVDEESLKQVVATTLNEKVPSGFAVGDTISIGQIRFQANDDGWMGEVPVTTRIIGVVEEKNLLAAILGLSLTEAVQVLKESAPIAEVRFSRDMKAVPVWAPWTRITTVSETSK